MKRSVFATYVFLTSCVVPAQADAANMSISVFSEQDACGGDYHDGCRNLTSKIYSRLAGSRYRVMQVTRIPPMYFDGQLRSLVVNYRERLENKTRRILTPRERMSLVMKMEFENSTNAIRIRRYEQDAEGEWRRAYCYPAEDCLFRPVDPVFYFHAPLEHFDRDKPLYWQIDLRSGHSEDDVQSWMWPVGTLPLSFDIPESN